MADADVDQCLGVWSDAFAESRRRLNLPTLIVADDAADRECRRVRRLLHTDPDGSWVATSGDRVIGLAQSIRREGLWVLSLLSVAVDTQGAGVGRSLLEAALGPPPRSAHGLILSSPEPRAASLYARAGFRPTPTMSAIGTVRLDGPPPGGVRRGGGDDLDLAAQVDRRIRGAAHGPDLDYLVEEGCRLLVVDGRGYAVVGPDGPMLLAAGDTDAARDLLLVALLAAEGPVAVHGITAAQTWALPVMAAAGLELRPGGALMVTGTPGPLVPYVPSGPFG
jgi:GNAT superfamily N-acetyltransferase